MRGVAGAFGAGFVLVALLLGLGFRSFIPREAADTRLVITDFDRPGFVTALGTGFGAWNRDPKDTTQFCQIRLVDAPRVGASGQSLRIDYDVDSPNPAYIGLWVKLPAVPITHAAFLTFSIKGDPATGFTNRVKLELKDGHTTAVYTLKGIRSEWRQVYIALNAFRDIERLGALTELVLVFDDHTANRPVGTLYLDDLALELAS